MKKSYVYLIIGCIWALVSGVLGAWGGPIAGIPNLLYAIFLMSYGLHLLQKSESNAVVSSSAGAS